MRALKMLWRYIKYRLRSVNRHSIHSPFLFAMIEEVLRGTSQLPEGRVIEAERRRLRQNEALIQFDEMGAGRPSTRSRRIAQLASSSLSTPEQCAILSRLVEYLDARSILEVGTSLGVTTAYLASATSGSVHTLEGNSAVLDEARRVWDNTAVSSKIRPHLGDFADTLPAVLEEMGRVDLAFIDGNHAEAPTLDYFEQILKYSHSGTIFVFDDIHWSEGMERAWATIGQHNSSRLTVDCFWMGLVAIDPGLSVQRFTLRY